MIGDPNDVQWSASQKQNKIEEAQERFVLDTRVLVDKTTDSVVSGTSEYDLPSDTIAITRIAVNGIEVKRTSKFTLDMLTNQNWSNDTGAAVYFYVDLDPNNKKFRIYPIPTAAQVGTNNIDIELIKIPPTLSGDSSVPFDGHTLLIPYHMALAYWAAKELLLINPSKENMVKVKAYEGEYNRLAEDCINTFKAMETEGPWRLLGGRYHSGV